MNSKAFILCSVRTLCKPPFLIHPTEKQSEEGKKNLRIYTNLETIQPAFTGSWFEWSEYHFKLMRGTSLVAQWLRLHTPSAGGLKLIPDERIRSCMLHLRSGAAQKKKKKKSLD